MQIGLRNFRRYGADLPRHFACAREIGATCLQLDGIADDRMAEAEQLIQETGISICSITALSTDMLGPDMEKSRRECVKIRRTIQQAGRLGATCVTVFAGRDPGKSLPDNVAIFKEVFSPLADDAASNDVTLAIENCPMGNGLHGIRNLAYCPENWDLLFEAVSSPGLGLELDYGHLPGLGIDPIFATKAAAGYIKHVGIKDAKVDRRAIDRRGWLGDVAAFCAVGEGEVAFDKVIPVLAGTGYRGALTLDHYRGLEDDVDTFGPAAGKIREIVSSLKV